jgi:hypothetical protein
MGLIPVARYAYVGLVWLFLLAVVIQVLLAGIGMFSTDPRDIALHINLGWVLHLWPVRSLSAAAIGRVGRPTLLWVGALVGTVLVQPLLPGLAATSVVLAALHPVNALLIFWIAVKLSMGGPALLPGRATS